MARRWDSYVVMSIGVGMTAAFCFLLFGPQQRELSTMLTSARAMREQLARGSGALAGFSTAEADMLQASDLLADYSLRVPPSAEVGAFVEDVSAIAARLELRNHTMVPLARETRGTLAVLPIRISFESGFRESFSFLHDVEHLARAVRVTELAVERLSEPRGTSAGDEGDAVRTELTMQVFYEAT